MQLRVQVQQTWQKLSSRERKIFVHSPRDHLTPACVSGARLFWRWCEGTGRQP